MRHCSVQVRGLLTKDELERYNHLIEVGHYLEETNRYDLVSIVQKEIDLLIVPAIDRLKEKGKQRDRDTADYLARKASIEQQLKDIEDEEDR